MKQFQKIIFLMAILPFLFIASCKDNDPAPATGKFAELSTYLQDNGLDLNNVLDGWIQLAPGSVVEVDAFLAGYHVMDIRSAEHFVEGHIEGAVNSSIGTIVADATGVTKPILVVCYSGQGAGHATVALRLSGHITAKVLKWGMSGWNSNNDSWSGATSNFAATHANWTFPSSPVTPLVHDFPEFTSTATGAELLAERVALMTEKGFQGVASVDVVDTPANYFINNYWSADDNATYGHISTAIRNSTYTLANEGFKDLDASKTVVTYCWTGQTSSMITAYLTVLGYDALSLKNGANSMIYDELTAHKWSADVIVDLPVVMD